MKKIILSILLSLIICGASNAQSPKELFESGVKQYKQGQFEQAIETFTELIQIEPDKADAYKNRGVAYMELKKYDQAITDFEKAKLIFPELQGLYSNMGVAWYYKKEYEKAIESYDKEIEISPDNHIVYFNRALSLTELNQDKRALGDLSKTLELKPDFYWAICYKADILSRQGDHITAIETYQKAIELAPESIYAIDKLARLRQKIQNTPVKQDADSPQKTILAENLPQEKNQTPDKSQPPPKKQAQEKKQSIDLSHEQETSGKKIIEMEDARPIQKGFTIQVGAFLSQDNAKRMNSKILENGFDSRILILKDSKDRTWYLIRIGNYPAIAGTKESRIQLKEKLGLSSVVRPYGTW